MPTCTRRTPSDSVTPAGESPSLAKPSSVTSWPRADNPRARFHTCRSPRRRPTVDELGQQQDSHPATPDTAPAAARRNHPRWAVPAVRFAVQRPVPEPQRPPCGEAFRLMVVASPSRPSSVRPEVSATSALVPVPTASTATGCASYSLSRHTTSASETTLPRPPRSPGPKLRIDNCSATPSSTSHIPQRLFERSAADQFKPGGGRPPEDRRHGRQDAVTLYSEASHRDDQRVTLRRRQGMVHRQGLTSVADQPD